MKTFYTLIGLLLFFTSYAQENNAESSGKGKINAEVVGGLLYSIPIGVYFKEQREDIRFLEENFPQFNGKLLPKTSAYVGVLMDYQFHDVGAIGFGVRWVPEGWWLFQESNGVKTKAFYTVDYFQIPLFYQEYLAKGKLSLRWGPVFSLAALTKVRVITKDGDNTEKDKYRFGENGFPLAKEFVPGFEVALNYGNNKGVHAGIAFKYSGSYIEGIDAKSFTINLGVGYTFAK